MGHLVLLRHAKSGYPDGVADHDRPLSSRGEREAPLAGRWLADHVSPALVIVSSAERTQQTWDLVLAEFDSVPPHHTEPRVYEATVSGLLAVLSDVDDSVDTVMIVGHNPGLEDLTHFLVGSGDPLAMADVNEKFPTSAIAVISLSASWSSVTKGCGELTSFIVPRS